MKRVPVANAAKVRPAVVPARVWRVFEYRRPLPVRRARFTT